MTFSELKDFVLAGGRGTIYSIVFGRELQLRKEFAGNTVVKVTFGSVRLGINYENTKAVAEKRASGELPPVNTGMKYGEWEVFPYFIKNGDRRYLRCYPNCSQSARMESRYFLNGKIVSKEEIQHMCLAKEFRSEDKQRIMFDIKVENIISIRQQRKQ